MLQARDMTRGVVRWGGVTAMLQAQGAQAVEMDTGSQVGLWLEAWSEPRPSAGQKSSFCWPLGNA